MINHEQSMAANEKLNMSVVQNSHNFVDNDLIGGGSFADHLNQTMNDGQKKLSPLMNGQGSNENTLYPYDGKLSSSDSSTVRGGTATVMKTVVINNSSSSSSGKGSKLLVVENYIEPIFKIEKVLSNKSNSNENSRGTDFPSS